MVPRRWLVSTRPVSQQRQTHTVCDDVFTVNWNTSPCRPNQPVVSQPQSAFQYSLWSPWIDSKIIQIQHIYVFTLGLGIVLFSLLMLTLSSLKYSSDCQRLEKKDRLLPSDDFSPAFLPPPTLPPPPFYPKYLTSYAVMLQLPNNPQLIKYAAFINNFYESRGNVLSLESWGRCFYTPLFPVCQCAVKCSEWSMHLALRHALDYTFFSWTFCKGGVFPVDFNEEEDKWGYLVIINM